MNQPVDSTQPFALDAWLRDRRAEIDALLDARLPLPVDDPGRLFEAVRYSVLAPGKRLRPILGLGAAQAVGGSLTEAVRVATLAVELIHCYSLIHDDLPAMDDDDLRRGRPSSHKVFGEAIAILAGDGLLTLAFDWLAEAACLGGGNQAAMVAAIRVLARAAGLYGMVRGQARDIAAGAPESLDALERLHREKTAALFSAATEVGALAGGGSAEECERLARFGLHYGIAFQHADDRDDAEHAHLAHEAAASLHEHVARALAAIAPFGTRARALAGLAQALVPR